MVCARRHPRKQIARGSASTFIREHRMPHHWLQKRFNALELYTIDVIYGRRSGAAAAVYGAFLQALSWLFSGAVQLRLWLYRHRIFHDQPLGCLVVVVGNLTVGGTGKTPVVEKFAREIGRAHV